MKVITYNLETEPAAEIECACGEIFWVDPCNEENLVTIGGRLIEKCPSCGLTNGAGKIAYPKLRD